MCGFISRTGRKQLQIKKFILYLHLLKPIFENEMQDISKNSWKKREKYIYKMKNAIKNMA